jgi:hypothetical protein
MSPVRATTTVFSGAEEPPLDVDPEPLGEQATIAATAVAPSPSASALVRRESL